MPHTEMLFVPQGPRDRCIVCRPSAPVLIDSLTDGTIELCIPHLLEASRHLAGEPYVEHQQPAPPPRVGYG